MLPLGFEGLNTRTKIRASQLKCYVCVHKNDNSCFVLMLQDPRHRKQWMNVSSYGPVLRTSVLSLAASRCKLFGFCIDIGRGGGSGENPFHKRVLSLARSSKVCGWCQRVKVTSKEVSPEWCQAVECVAGKQFYCLTARFIRSSVFARTRVPISTENPVILIDMFHGYPWPLQTNVRIVSSIRPWPLPYTSLPFL